MALDDVYQLNVVHLLNGKETTNVFYYLETKASILSADDIAGELCKKFFTVVYVPLWQPNVSERGELSAIWCKRIWPTVADPRAVPYTDEQGNVLGDSCPNNACALLSMRAQGDVRNFQRRCYISGIPESRQVGAEINVIQEVSMRALAEGIRDNTLIPASDPGAEFTACAYSKKLAAASAPVVAKVIRGVSVTRAIRSQRGRNLFTWTKGI